MRKRDEGRKIERESEREREKYCTKIERETEDTMVEYKCTH